MPSMSDVNPPLNLERLERTLRRELDQAIEDDHHIKSLEELLRYMRGSAINIDILPTGVVDRAFGLYNKLWAERHGPENAPPSPARSDFTQERPAVNMSDGENLVKILVRSPDRDEQSAVPVQCIRNESMECLVDPEVVRVVLGGRVVGEKVRLHWEYVPAEASNPSVPTTGVGEFKVIPQRGYYSMVLGKDCQGCKPSTSGAAQSNDNENADDSDDNGPAFRAALGVAIVSTAKEIAKEMVRKRCSSGSDMRNTKRQKPGPA